MKFWYARRGWLAQLLRPLSWLYLFIVQLRRLMYNYHLLRRYKLTVPVIVVGNITVGGSGKTPAVIALSRWAKVHGYRVGIVLRGYGGQVGAKQVLVSEHSLATEVGDEALLLYQHASAAAVMVSSQRGPAALQLQRKYACDLIISDDGLQHYALEREIEINVLDMARGYGNGLCLPAGPLREPVARATEVDFTLEHRAADTKDQFSTDLKRFSMCLLPGVAYNLLNTVRYLDPNQPSMQHVHAVAGIGNPARFFMLLRQLGFTLQEHAFPDHHSFSRQDLEFGDDLPIIMTSKDAVKCQIFALPNVWCLPVEAEIDEDFWAQLRQRLRS